MEVSSRKQASGQRSISKYNDYDLDNLSFQPPSLRLVRESSPQTHALDGSSMMGQEGPFLSSQRKVTKRVYPTRIESKRSTSPQGKRFQKSSPASVAEAASRSHSGTEFQSHRASEGNGWFGRNRTIDDRDQQPSAMTTHNIFGRQHQIELIDAFGNYRGNDTLNENFPKIQRIDVNGMKGVVGKMDWQNSEEEEYVWEDMSPTLADSSKRKIIFSRPSSRNWSVPPLKDSATVIDDKIAIGDFGFGPMNKMYLNDTGSTQLQHHESSQNVQEYGSFPNVFHHSQDNLSSKSHARPFQLPYLVSGVTPVKLHGLNGNSHNSEMPLLKLSSTSPDSLNMEMSIVAAQKTHQPSLSSVIWPPAQNSQYVQLLPMPNNLQMDNNQPVVNQQLFSVPFTQQQFDANGRNLFKQAFQENLGSFTPSAIAQTPADFAQPLSSVQHQSSTVLDSILRTMPTLPPGLPPSLLQPITTPLNSSATPHSSVIEYSGLISSLMAQGLISLTRPDQPKDTANLEFNAELLKIRSESAINSLYTELSRQCTTCGLRFKCQEDHSNHMDWHVAKNRMSRNRKQKPSSRKWFVSEWLCGAETLGADAVPVFLPTETDPDKKENRELAVPADENQRVCALYGESFEDFYSDETEEWMYRGAVYLNAPNGDVEDLDRSQLGPIVHDKCRPESAEVNG